MTDYRQPRGRRVRHAVMARVGAVLLIAIAALASYPASGSSVSIPERATPTAWYIDLITRPIPSSLKPGGVLPLGSN